MLLEAYHEYLEAINVKYTDIDIQSIFLHGSIDHLQCTTLNCNSHTCKGVDNGRGARGAKTSHIF